MSARIVIVDDDPQVARLLLRHLERLGYEVRPAGSGPEAIEIALAWPADLLITDLLMPGMDGIELIRLVTSTSDIPVIAMSGGGIMEKELLLGQAKALGAVRILEKPFALEAVTSEVAAALAGRAEAS